jgi:hypothetical protein
VKRDAKAGFLNHAEIVRAIADRQRFLARKAKLFAQLDQRFDFCLASKDRFGNAAGQFAVDEDKFVRLIGIEADRVRDALGPRAADVEAVEVRSETPWNALPEAARARLGMRPGQKNVLLRLVLRALGRTLTDDEANRLRDAVYAAVHEGTEHAWACGPVAT